MLRVDLCCEASMLFNKIALQCQRSHLESVSFFGDSCTLAELGLQPADKLKASAEQSWSCGGIAGLGEAACPRV